MTHIRPLPSDSTTQTEPVSAIAKLAPLKPAFTRRNFSRRNARAARVRSSGSRSERLQLHRALEQLADFGAVLVQRRHHDVRRAILTELDDQIGEVGLVRDDAGLLERAIQSRLVRRHRLDLDDLAFVMLLDDLDDDAVGFVGVASPVDRAAGARAGGLELFEVEVEMTEGVILDRVRRLRELLPVGHLADDGRALVADDVGGAADVAAQLVAAEGPLRRDRKLGRRRGVADADHSSLCAGSKLRSICRGRISARWTAARRPPADGAGRRRCASGRSCRRRRRPRRFVSRMQPILSFSIATETSAFFTANVPPKPQHSSLARQLDQASTPRTARSSAQRLLADAQRAQRVARTYAASPRAERPRRRR